MIVNSSIKALYDKDIDNCAYGAVLDEAFQDIEKYERLEYKREKLYCNAGMMMINLAYWRNNQVMERCLDYIEKNPSKVLFHDQDTINVVLQDEKKLLPLKYNFQTGFILTHYKFDDIIMHEILESVYSPIIIHYTGGISKPWFAKSKHPYTNVFLYYKNISIWREFPLLDRRTFYNKFVDFMLELIWVLGIKKRPKSYIIEMQKK
jgi:lipopolysaccharide biosynthesis glycosyltransferase